MFLLLCLIDFTQYDTIMLLQMALYGIISSFLVTEQYPIVYMYHISLSIPRSMDI